MKNHKFQMIRISVPGPAASVRFTGETDKGYKRVRGVFVALPSTLSVWIDVEPRVSGMDIFDEDHDVRLITAGLGVAPNEKFFLLEEFIEAGGVAFEGKFKDAGLEGPHTPMRPRCFCGSLMKKPSKIWRASEG